MYGSLAGMELGFGMMALLAAWIAGSKASALVYSGTPERLRRKIGKLTAWAVAAAFMAIVVLICEAGIAVMQPTLYWEDRIFVHAPLIVVPLVVVWCYSMPRLWRLKKRLASGPSESPDQLAEAHAVNRTLAPELRAQLAAPGVVLPFQTAAIGAATALFFTMAVPFPFRPLQAATPLFLCILAIIGLWMLHDRRWQRAGKADADFTDRHWQRRARSFGIGSGGAVLAIVIITIGSQSSRLPDELDMATGPMDFGGGTVFAHNLSQAVSVAMLTGPRDGEPVRRIAMTAERKSLTLPSGRTIETWTYNGEIPGPELRFKQGELIEVTLTNKDIDDGVTIHWHGLDVPNAEDGVAGATQDAVLPGQSHTYRFKTEQVGTFWYHSHQHSLDAVEKGLFGALIVEPAGAASEDKGDDRAADTADIGHAASTGDNGHAVGTADAFGQPRLDFTVISHLWKDTFMIGDVAGIRREAAAPGTEVTLRLINTDNWIRQQYALAGSDFRITAIDGTPLNEPGTLRDTELQLTSGGRYDVTFTMPDHPVFLRVGNPHSGLGMLVSPNPDGSGELPDVPKQTAVFDPTHYGKPADTPFDANSKFDRHFTLVLDNKLGYYNGQFGFLYTMNGEVFPNTPMFMVREGELIKTTIVNRGSVDHPMHLHGHHMLVLSRNGEASDGSPWWSDTLDILPGETYEVAFRADNPGIWMDHCHNLTHAAVGMSMHLMYEGVDTPYTIGSKSINHPE